MKFALLILFLSVISITFNANSLLFGKGGKMLKTDKQREKLVIEELGKVNDYVIKHDASKLSNEDKKFIKHLSRAAKIVGIINKLQINPKNLDYEKEINEKGTDADKKLYKRYQMPWCISIKDKMCNADPSMPVKKIGWYHWPENMTDKEFEQMHKASNSKELLSPYTIVRRDKKQGFKAIPFIEDPIFAPYVKELSQELKLAAKSTEDPSTKAFLEKRANAFLSKKAYPYDDSDYDWIALKGKWDITVGPYEVYKNPKQTKARFEMYFGKVDKKITAQLNKFKANLQEMERALGKVVGNKIYKSRKIDPRISIRAIDVWMASGDGRNPQGAVVAYHLPNIGRAVDEGLYKKVMLVTHSKAFSNIVKARAALILDPEQIKFLSEDADILDTTFHEFSHGFGAYDNLPIVDYKGAKTTVHQGMKELSSLMEEEKADTFGLWFAEYFLKKGWIGKKELHERYVSHFMHLLGLLQYPLEGTYPRMVAVQLGFYMEHKAVSYDPKTSKWHVNFDNMIKAVNKLAPMIATYQLTGNYPAASKLVSYYVFKNKAGKFELAPLLKAPVNDASSRFKKAGIKSIAIHYQIDNL